jgi:hypothetical protein
MLESDVQVVRREARELSRLWDRQDLCFIFTKLCKVGRYFKRIEMDENPRADDATVDAAEEMHQDQVEARAD